MTELAKHFSSKDTFKGSPSKGMPFLIVSAPKQELENALKAMPEVEYVEQDRVLEGSPETVASRSNQESWGLLRIDTGASGLKEKAAPSKAKADRKNVHVYVMDTGIRTSHSEFGGRAIPTLEVDNLLLKECHEGDMRCAEDKHGHGTHAAATVGGQTLGVEPGATVHAVKVLNDQAQGSYANILMAMDWVLQHGQKPAVMLTGVTSDSNVDTSRSLKDAVDKATADGVSVIVGGGDSKENACRTTPGFVPSAITVGASTEKDEREPSSNFGNCLDLFAPGTNIKTADILSDTGLVSVTGSSVAAAHVAGAVAVALAADPTKTAQEVTTQLIKTAADGAVMGAMNGSPNKLLRVQLTATN